MREIRQIESRSVVVVQDIDMKVAGISKLEDDGGGCDTIVCVEYNDDWHQRIGG
jgi:hypothetical protein